MAGRRKSKTGDWDRISVAQPSTGPNSKSRAHIGFGAGGCSTPLPHNKKACAWPLSRDFLISFRGGPRVKVDFLTAFCFVC